MNKIHMKKENMRKLSKTCCFVSALVRQESTDIYGRFCAESIRIMYIYIYDLYIYIYFLTSGSVHVWKLVG